VNTKGRKGCGVNCAASKAPHEFNGEVEVVCAAVVAAVVVSVFGARAAVVATAAAVAAVAAAEAVRGVQVAEGEDAGQETG
jgi:hypothetical protein